MGGDWDTWPLGGRGAWLPPPVPSHLSGRLSAAAMGSWGGGPPLCGSPGSAPRRYALLRIVNVEKRRDSARGSRFLLELELQERGGRRLRLSEYVFLRLPGARAGDTEEDQESPEPAAASARPDGRPELCRPLRLAWRQDVMVHFVVPGASGVAGSAT